jgi:hypothetical protein
MKPPCVMTQNKKPQLGKPLPVPHLLSGNLGGHDEMQRIKLQVKTQILAAITSL